MATVIMGGTFLIGLAGIFRFIDLQPEQVTAALIGPILGVIVAVFQGKHIFEDSESIFQLNRKLCDQELEFKKRFSDYELQRDKKDADAELQRQKKALELQKTNDARIKNLEAEVSRWQRTALSNQNRPKTTSIRPASPIVGGNETTQK